MQGMGPNLLPSSIDGNSRAEGELGREDGLGHTDLGASGASMTSSGSRLYPFSH